MGRSCSSHARPTAAQETAARRSTARKVFPWRPKKRFKTTLQISLNALGNNPDTGEQTAEDRDKWRSSIHKGSTACEADRTAAAELRRQTRKAGASDPLPDVPAIPCPLCQRTFQARIGLVSRLHIHGPIQPPNPRLTEVVFAAPRGKHTHSIMQRYKSAA